MNISLKPKSTNKKPNPNFTPPATVKKNKEVKYEKLSEGSLSVYKVHGTVEDFMKTKEFQDFNDYVNAYYDYIYNTAMTEMKDETNKLIFKDWWNGGHIFTEDYKYRDVVKNPKSEVHNYCLWACSMGCG